MAYLQAGKYYVGDLCYVMHKEWDEVCDLILSKNRPQEGVFTLKDGRKFAIFDTRYGDGTYYDQKNREYPVDSGSIGCILASDVTEKIDEELGNIIEFSSEFRPWSDGKTLNFGKVAIETDY